MDLASFYKCLSEQTRLRIVNLLLQGKPLCVCQIQEALQEPQVKVSKHLGYMKSRGLLTLQRKANWNFYEIGPEVGAIERQTLEALKSNANSQSDLAVDLERLRKAQDSECC